MHCFSVVSEQQELLRQINSSQNLEEKQDLRKELEKLVARMEEKGGQISKLRKHQQTVSEHQKPEIWSLKRSEFVVMSELCAVFFHRPKN